MQGVSSRQLATLTAVLLLSIFHLLPINPVSAAINEQMHFQGRLRTSSQGIVPDGDYNLRFKIYSGGDGSLGTADETLEWTETYDSTNQVRVENGYFAVQLGELTSLSTVDFSNDTLWLSLDVGGTSGTPSWDGEMDPFIRLSATPYAFQAGNSDTLDDYDSLDFARLDEAANFTAALQQAGSNVCTEAGNCSIGDGVGSGDAFLQGGNSFGATATLGTNDLFDLAFETNGAEHMRIDTAGEVGIGTTTPGYKLDVQNGTGIVGRFSGRVIGADAVNTDEFATLGQVNSATADSTKVASLNTFTGDLTVQGTAGKVTVSDNGTDTLTINLHADVSLLGQTIEGSEITDNTITNADIAADTIGATEIATDAVGSDEISDNAIQEIDLETTNVATDNYVLSYDSTSGGFTWVVDNTGTDTQLSELEVEAYIFDNDNTGTLSSGTLALDSLSYTGQLDDANVADALTISSSGSVADGALSSNVSLLGQSIDSGEITDGTIQEVELNTTNVATDNYVLSYDSTSGGFTWVQDVDTQLTETEVEGFIFDGDNTGTLSSGTLALGSLSFTGNLTDTYVSDTLTIGSGSTVDDGALSSNVSLLGQSIDSSEITDNTVQEVDLETTNAATDNYVLSYDTTSGGFTWVEDADTQLSELEVEGFIFDGDNTGTLSSGTLALDSLSFTGNLTDTYISDTLTIGSSSSVADGALSANVALLDRTTQTFTGNNTFSGTTTLSSLDCTTFANGGTLTTNGTGEVICANDDGGSGGGEVSSLNSLDGALTLQGTTNEIEITDNSTDTITVGLPNSVTIDTLTLTNALTVGNGGTGATTIGSAGSIAYSDGSTYNFTSQGTSGQCLVSNGSGIPSWGNCSGSGAGAVTLQKAYDNGGTINTTNSGGDIAFTLEDTSTDHSFVVNIADGAPGTASINRLNGTGTVDPAYLLKLDNQDTDRSVADGLFIQAAGGGLTDGIDASDADITNALNIGANTIQGTNGVIDFTNFDVDGSGNVTLAGTLQLSPLDCTTFANGGSLTTNASGDVVCSDDDGGTGGGSTSINSLSGALTLQGTTNEIEITDNGTDTLTVGLPDDVTIGNNLTVTNNTTFNGNLTVAATNTITLTGGTTLQRPASPTEGMLYFDTDTDTLLTYSNGKWQADRTESIIVAASDSTQAEKDSADYIADGTDDQVEINNALTEAAGGKVYLLPGTYTTHQTNDGDATISIPNNTTLAGAGKGTLIQLGDIDATDNLIENTDQTTGTGVAIRDLRLDGQKSLNTSGTQHGMSFDGMGDSSTDRIGAKITNVWAENFSNHGLVLSSSDNNTVTNVLAKNNNYGFMLSSGSDNNILNSNTSLQNTGYGIYFYNNNNNIASDNVLKGNSYGILVEAAENTVSNNMIVNNTSRGISLEDLFAAGITHDNIIIGNRIIDSGGSANNNAIYTIDADSNIITNNVITDSSATTNYAINIAGSSSENNYLANNTLGGGTVNDAGTDTIYGGQLDGSDNYVLQGYGGALDLNGNENTALTVSNGTNTTTLDFANPTGDVTITFPALSPGSYDVCTSAGNCDGAGGTLQTAYNNSTSPEITVNGSNGALTVQDASTPIGANLLEVTSNGGGTTYFAVDVNGISVTGTGSFSSTVTASGFDTASAATLNIGSSNATSISLGQNTSVLGAFDASGTITFSGLANCNTIDTDASGVLSCGTDETGSGGGGGTVTKKLVPEFAGGTLSADGTNNTGVMTADHVTGLSSVEGYKHNYYQWKTNSTTSQDYDIVINYQLPSDFNATNEFNTSSWKVWTYADSTTDGSLAITIEDADLGTACVASESITPSTNQTWEQITLTTNPNTNCTFNPDDIITITVKMTSKDNSGNKPVRLGEIQFSYDK